MRSADTWVGWVASVALGLLLITTNVRVAANSLWLYEQLFERNNVPARTGITMAELRKVGETIQDYFNSDNEPLYVEASINGETVVLFDEDEVSHMADVKKLFRRTYTLQTVSLVVLLAMLAYAAYRHRRRATPLIALWLARGGTLIAVAVIGIGLASVVAFDQVFLLFHYIGFPGGNFTFNSQTDYLVRVFPQGFWSDITFVIGAMTLVEAALIYVAARLIRRRSAADRTP